VLASLIDKNLLRRRPESDRYWMLTTIREFAAERLAAEGEEPELVHAATRALTDVAAGIARRMEFDETWLPDFEAEEPNLVHLADAALRNGFADEALGLASAASSPQRDAGRLRQARDMLSRALDAAPDAPPDVRAQALNGLCTAFHGLAEWERARECAAEAQALAAACGAAETELRALGNLGALSVELGDTRGGTDFLVRVIELARAIGDETELARASFNLGELILLDDPPAAVELLEAALEIVQRTGHQVGEILCLTRLGDARLRLGDAVAAARLLTDAVALAVRSNRSFYAPEPLEELAGIASARDDVVAGRAFLAAAASLRELHGSGLSDRARERRDETAATLGWRADAGDGGVASLERCVELAEALTDSLVGAERAGADGRVR
jgi:tetratricopeptide (TPR) repeat protein